MIRVVLDTSVLVSAAISPTGPNAQVFDLITAERIRPCLTDVVLAEYHRVFEYKRLQHLDRRRIAKLRVLLEAVSVKVKPRGRLKISDHEDDNRIYECAAAAKAHYIITENTNISPSPTKPPRSSMPANCSNCSALLSRMLWPRPNLTRQRKKSCSVFPIS